MSRVTISGTRCARRVTSLLALGLLTACSVQVDSRPRDIDPKGLPGVQPLVGDSASIRTGQTTRVFFLDAGDGAGPSRLRVVGRDAADTPTDRLYALFLGPTASEQALQISSALSSNIAPKRVTTSSPQAVTIDMPKDFDALVAPILIDALAQIVYTATESDGITEVIITVDGASRQWPRGNGAITARPLTRFDFPDSNPTSEPDFPPVPSPN